MKKFATFALVFAFCLSLIILPASATETYTDFNGWDLSKSHNEVFFADVIYQGQVVGYGYLHYTAGSKGWWFIKGTNGTIQTEYQNYNLPRDFGKNNGIDVTVYSYGRGDSGSDYEYYSWSDQAYQGGNTLGWIESKAYLADLYPTYMTGFVRVTTSSSSDTVHYRIYG